LRDLDEDSVALCFPRAFSYGGMPTSGPSALGVAGYAVFGHDAYILVSAALQDAVENGRPKADLCGRIARLAEIPGAESGLIEDYRFDKAGENAKGKFSVFEVGKHGQLP